MSMLGSDADLGVVLFTVAMPVTINKGKERSYFMKLPDVAGASGALD